jgi:Divergent InlB B-repeat domain
VKSHAKASSLGSSSTAGTKAGKPSRRPLAALLAFALALLLLLPAAHAAAAETMHVKVEGTGEGEVSSVGGVSAFESGDPGQNEFFDGFGTAFEGSPPIECEGPPATGTCEAPLVEDSEGIKSIALHAVAAPGSEFAGWVIEEGAGAVLGCKVGGPLTKEGETPKYCLENMEEGGDVRVTAIFISHKMHVNIEGTGEGEVSSVGGVAAFESEDESINEFFDGFGTAFEGSPPIECAGPPPGGTCETPLVEDVEGIKSIALHAIPAPGSEFAGWVVEEGNGAVLGCEVGGPATAEGETPKYCLQNAGEANGEVRLTAIFNEITFQLSIDTSGGTGTGQVDCEVNGGESFDEPCATEYPEGTELKLIPHPAPHNEFNGFENATGSAEGVCTGTSPCEITLEEDTALDAPFDAILHSLTVEAGPGGKVDGEEPPAPVSGEIAACEEAAGSCEATYEAGQTVTLVATPDLGKVADWTSGCDAVPTPNECEVEIQDGSDSTVEVEFVGAPPRDITVEPTGEGKVSAEASPAPEAGEISECEEGGSPSDCEATYSEGQAVTLVATPGIHRHVSWSGCTPVVGQPNKCKVVLGGSNVSVGADFVLNEFKLTVTKPGTGAGTVTGGSTTRPSTVNCGSGTGCEPLYVEGEEVTLSATPAAGSAFTGWTGCSSEPSATECKVTMSAAKNVTATFTAEFKLTVTKPGTGSGTVTGGSTARPSTVNCGSGTGCEPLYVEGEEVTLTATPATGSAFTGWSGCSSEPSATECEVTMSEAKNVTATFTSEFKLSVSKPGSGAGTVTGGSPARPNTVNCGTGTGCEPEYVEGEEVTLTAAASPGSAFTGWTGCTPVSGHPEECEVTISAAKNVTATFKPEFKLDVKKSGAGSGTVTGGSPARPETINCGTLTGCEHNYVEGELVTLKASANTGSAFTGWSGCTPLSGHADECEVTMSAAKSVTATFKTEFKLSVAKAGSGTVKGGSTARPETIDCGTGSGCEAKYVQGEAVTLTATPDPHQQVAWSGCTSATANTCEVTMSGTKKVTATFSPITHTLTVNKAGSGSGSVSCNGAPCAPSYNEGTSVTLSASADSGSSFTGWSGGGLLGHRPLHGHARRRHRRDGHLRRQPAGARTGARPCTDPNPCADPQTAQMQEGLQEEEGPRQNEVREGQKAPPQTQRALR